MPVHEIPLPSPPPDTRLMSGLFSADVCEDQTSDVIREQDQIEVDYVARKRVEFHPWTMNILEAQLSTPDSEVAPSLKSLPPSRDCQLSSRPILKPTLSSEGAFATRFSEQNEKPSTLENMDSLIQHLSNGDRPSCTDAYQTMTSLIKVYDEVPEQDVLQQKMAQLQKFIRRDLVVLDTNTDTLPSEERLSMGNLVMSSLKVLVTMVWSPIYSPCLTDDFRSWTIERSIHILKEHTASKAILLHYMHLIATQSFRSPLITSNNRATRILEVLHELTEHISGKAVAAERMIVYQKLFEQAKTVMKTKPELWMKNLLMAMSHSFKEVRLNAISAGTKACTVLAGSATIAAAARAALEEVTNDRTMSISTTNRLERVLAAKDEANQVPQIWTIVLMLCNTGQSKLDSWPQLHDWLKLIQRCFNCGDANVKTQAFMAWNRLYYIARPHEASDKVVSMLAKPTFTQLEKTGNNQTGKGTRQAVVSSYCMLLYYAFRPAANYLQYTRMWNEFVVKLMTRSFLSKSSPNCDLSCRVLSALFHNPPSVSRVWNENRAHGNAPLDPLELPAIDSKWTRSKLVSIMSIMQLLVQHSSFGPNGTMSEHSYVAQAWTSLMKAIRESCNKEIVPSADSKVALNSILDFLRPTSDGIAATEAYPTTVERSRLLARLAVAELGASTTIQALEGSSNTTNIFVLKELALMLFSSLESPESQPLALDKLLERCLQLFKAEKVFMDQSPTNQALAQIHMLDAAYDILQQTQSHRVRDILLALQRVIAAPIREKDEELWARASHARSDLSHGNFCSVVTKRIREVNSLDYKLLDELLWALLSSPNAATHAPLVELIKDRLSIEGRSSYGPKLQAWSLNKSGLSPVRLSDGCDTNPNDEDLEAYAQDTRYVYAKPPLMKPIEPIVKTKRKHDDSQIDFVPIDSSPPNYEIFESQLLTTRQKEVREKQNTEPVLTFADIRSSPSTSKKQTRSNEEVRGESPQLPATPTIVQQKGHEADDQPPTPTPKARKAFQFYVQPDVLSSPQSILNGEDQGRRATAISSSPVKDPTEADDSVQLGNLDEAGIVIYVAQQEPVTEKDNANFNAIEQVAPVDQNVPHESTTESSHEQYETAEDNAQSPMIYSDEYDALAASQLSQNLVEQSQSAHDTAETAEVEHQAASKRKRKQDQPADASKKKRRKSAHTLDGAFERTEKKLVQPLVEDEDMEDCIVVNMDHIKLHPQLDGSRSSKRAKTSVTPSSSPAPSHVSRRSTASTPSSQTSTGRRKKRTKKGLRPCASQDTILNTQIPVLRSEEMDDVAAVGMQTALNDNQPVSELPSLGSEVRQSGESDLRLLAATEQEQPLEAEKMAGIMKTPTIEPQVDVMPIPGHTLVKPSTASTMHSQGTNTHFDIVQGLQSMLDSLSTHDASAHGKDIDLAAVYNLCFSIGLKAKELAKK